MRTLYYGVFNLNVVGGLQVGLPEFMHQNEYFHHLTLLFVRKGVSLEDKARFERLLGSECVVTTQKHLHNEEVQALTCALPPKLRRAFRGDHPHITLSTNGVPPFRASELCGKLWDDEDQTPLRLLVEGRVGAAMSDGSIRFKSLQTKNGFGNWECGCQGFHNNGKNYVLYDCCEGGYMTLFTRDMTSSHCDPEEKVFFPLHPKEMEILMERLAKQLAKGAQAMELALCLSQILEQNQ